MKTSVFTPFCIAVAFAGLFASSAVLAQDGAAKDAKDSPLYFANVDKNGDGSIGRSEVPKELHDLRTHFDQYDVNHDHRLSKAEYVSFLATLNQGACRENDHTAAKCATSPYSMSTPTMGVGADNGPKGHPQGQ